MLTSKLRALLLIGLLFAAFCGLVAFYFPRPFALQQLSSMASLLLWPLLMLAFVLACLFPLLVWLGLGVLTFSPFLLGAGLNSLLRVVRRRQRLRAARQQFNLLCQQLPPPARPPQADFTPWTQRRFKQPTQP